MHTLIQKLETMRRCLQEEYQGTSLAGSGRAYLIRHLATLDLVIDALADMSLGQPQTLRGVAALDALRQMLAPDWEE